MTRLTKETKSHKSKKHATDFKGSYLYLVCCQNFSLFLFCLFCVRFLHSKALSIVMHDVLYRVRKSKDTPIILCRTKADLNLPFKDRQKVLTWAKCHNVPFLSTSSKTPTNVDLLFEIACRVALSKRPVRTKSKKRD